MTRLDNDIGRLERELSALRVRSSMTLAQLHERAIDRLTSPAVFAVAAGLGVAAGFATGRSDGDDRQSRPNRFLSGLTSNFLKIAGAASTIAQTGSAVEMMADAYRRQREHHHHGGPEVRQ